MENQNKQSIIKINKELNKIKKENTEMKTVIATLSKAISNLIICRQNQKRTSKIKRTQL